MRNEIGWVEKFYPVSADDCDLGKEIEHSILKWTGLRIENLMTYGLTTPPIEISSDSCALCVRYYSSSDWLDGVKQCSACPITILRGASCDNETPTQDSEEYTPWGSWIHQRDPEPMINLLERCLATKQRSLPNSHAEGH